MTRFEQIELFAWMGEDDQLDKTQRTGEIGIKQAQVPAGLIPMVAIDRSKMEKYWHHAEAQARRTGVKIKLCRFVLAEVVRETDNGV